MYAYNTSVQESTCFSPFEVMFGCKATMPIDIDMATKRPEDRLQKCLDAEELSPSKVKKMESQRQELLQQVKANILKAQEKQKEYYDRKHANPGAYTVGAKVLKKDFLCKKRKGGKMDARFLGPYIITKDLGRGLYSLELIEDRTVVVHRVNGAHLKPYQTPCQSPESSTHKETPPKPARINPLTTAQTIAMQEILPQLATASRLTRRPLKIHFHHCRHQCLLCIHSNVNWTQALDLHRLLSRGLVPLQQWINRRTRKPPNSHSQSSLNQNTQHSTTFIS